VYFGSFSWLPPFGFFMSHIETARLVPLYCPDEGNKERKGRLRLRLTPEKIQKKREWPSPEFFPHALSVAL